MSGDKPRLCIVNPFEHGGGAEYQIALLIDALAAQDRYDIHYLTHFVDERSRTRNYRVDRIGSGGPIPRFGYLMEGRSLFRALRALEPSVIYQRVACGYTGLCARYARRNGIPMVWHVAHDTDVTPQILDGARNVVRVRLEKWLVEYGARRATRVVVQTRHQGDLLRRHYSREADAVIGNFHPPAAEEIDKSGPLTVLWIANLKPWKRPDAFVRLARGLADQTGVRFVMVGAPAANAGNQQWQEALLRDIEATPNLDFVGAKTHAEVNRLLGRAHVFVNTSTHEGFPNTFIQAWQRGVAVVSLQVDPDGVLGGQRVGIAAGSEAGLLAAVRGLLDDPASRAGYSERGMAYADAKHSLGNIDALIRLIESGSAGAA